MQASEGDATIVPYSPAVTANTDETPIPYTLKRKFTVAKKGAKLVKSKQLNSKIKLTRTLTVAQAGEKLKSFMIFTGKRTAKLKHFNKMHHNYVLYPQEIY